MSDDLRSLAVARVAEDLAGAVVPTYGSQLLAAASRAVDITLALVAEELDTLVACLNDPTDAIRELAAALAPVAADGEPSAGPAR